MAAKRRVAKSTAKASTAAKSGKESAEAKTDEMSRVKKWHDRIRAANAEHEKWSKRFEVTRGEDYYDGFQWYGLDEVEAQSKYVVNLTASSIESNKPALLFYKPQYRVEPRPATLQDAGAAEAEAQARLSQDALQTWVDDPNVDFALETGLGVHEAHFRFAIVEVGYTADFLDNPNADKPVLQEKDPKSDPNAQTDGPTQPAKLVEHEAIYVKRIPASTFRVSISGKNKLAANDWVGYYEWHYVQDIKRNPRYQNTKDLKSTGVIDEAYGSTIGDDDREQHRGMVRLWKIWDLREGVKHVLADGHQQFLMEGKAFQFLPFADLKFLERLDHYYPKPVVFDWLRPQDEFNDQREMKKIHRKRFYRRYAALKGAVDSTELEKFEKGPDGVIIEEKQANAIRPVQDATLQGVDAGDTLQTLNDFTMVSGISGEQRQVAQADTATQANIIDSRARMRESSARTKVANWLGRIGRLMLLTARENLALPMVIKLHGGHERDPQAAATAAARWKEISKQELGSLDLDVTVELASLSPVTQDMQRAAWNQVLALLSNANMVLVLSQSEPLLRKTLMLYGITSEHDIQEIKQAVAISAQALQAQAVSAAGGPGGGAALPAVPGLPAGIPAGGPMGVQ